MDDIRKAAEGVMCECENLIKQAQRVFEENKRWVQMGNEDGPYHAREMKMVGIQKLVSVFPQDQQVCLCEFAPRVNSMIDLLNQAKTFSGGGGGDMAERAAKDNVYALLRGFADNDEKMMSLAAVLFLIQ